MQMLNIIFLTYNFVQVVSVKLQSYDSVKNTFLFVYNCYE